MEFKSINLKNSFLCVLLGVSFCVVSCTESNTEQVATTLPEAPVDSLNQKATDSMLCYRNESFLPDKPTDKDIDELEINIQSGVVKGVYNWIPKFKDRRIGKFEGVIKDSVIHASYIFLQEGISDTSDIRITFNVNQAVIEGDRQELGLSKTLKRVQCEK